MKLASRPLSRALPAPRRHASHESDHTFQPASFAASLANHKNNDPLFSIACTLFSIHNSSHPYYFLSHAHSLPKTPGGGRQQPSRIGISSITPIKSKRFAKIAPKSNRMQTFYDTPQGVGVRCPVVQLHPPAIIWTAA